MRGARVSLCVIAALVTAGCTLAPQPRRPEPGRGSTAVAPAVDRAVHSRSGLPATSDPVLHDWALYQTIEAHARAGDLEAARTAAERLEVSYPESTWLGRARLEVGLATQRAGDQAEAADWLERAAISLDHEVAYWARARLAQAEATAAVGRNEAAFEQAGTLRRSRLPLTVASRRAQRLARRLVRRDPALLAEPGARLAEAELRLGEGDAQGASTLVRELARGSSPDRDAARWVVARAWRALGRDDDATALCRDLAREGDRALGAAALYAAARWHWNDDRDGVAAALFDEVRLRFPGSDEADGASYALGRIHQTAGRWDDAVTAYDRVRSSRLGTDAGWGAAWSRYLAGRWHDAAARFQALGSSIGPEGENAAAYWEARALANAGDPRGMATLRRLAEHAVDGYYGYMAARYVTGAAPNLPPPVLAAPVEPPFPENLDGPHAARARAYLALGRRDLARREVDAIAPAAPPALVVEAYEAVGAPGPALRLARRSFRSDERRERRLYPLGYWETVTAAATRRHVDPLLVLALIRQESAFDTGAVSPADAHGLMQLLPATATEVARELGMPPPDRWDLRRPSLNVALGTRLLARLLEEYDGSAIHALAAYNAGTPAVAKWTARGSDRAEDEFVELISYAETRRYVKKVLGNYLRYRRIYTPTALASNAGSPPNAPFDMTTRTSPGRAESAR